MCGAGYIHILYYISYVYMSVYVFVHVYMKIGVCACVHVCMNAPVGASMGREYNSDTQRQVYWLPRLYNLPRINVVWHCLRVRH